ncbi:MAG: hypothetical protein NVSMB25_11620 [Thermoleophilaceae bacterium]
MMPLAIFGISSSGINLAIKLVLLVLIAVWAALVFWTYTDARRRIADPMLVGCAAFVSFLFPFVGTIIYMIVRPPEFLDDAHERELEIAAAEARLAQVEQLACPYCDFEIEKNFLRCPSCLRRLKEPCGTCGRPLDPRWKICPYCEAEVGQAAGQARRRTNRRTPAAAGPAERAAPPRPPQPAAVPQQQPAVARTPPPPPPPPPAGAPTEPPPTAVRGNRPPGR